MGDPAHLPCVLALALVPVLARAQALALAQAQALASSSGVWSVLKDLDLGGRTNHARGWPVHGLTPPKTIQKQ